MSDKKTPEQRAEKYVLENWTDGDQGHNHVDIAKEAFLAGHADFIKYRLPKLLEMAREMLTIGDPNGPYTDWAYTMESLLVMAEKGEV